MDIVKIQSLIAQGRIVEAADINADETFLQVGIYQPNNRRVGSGNADSYPSFAIALSQLGASYKYEIGQYVNSEGGVIFHRWLSKTPGTEPASGTVQNYLVMTSDSFIGSYSWGLAGINVANSESTWDGLSNTSAIISAGALATDAAGVCNNYSYLGKSDWYLPSIDELNKIWINRRDVAQGLIVASASPILLTKYWSSTEYDKNTSYLQEFSGGNIAADNKSNLSVTLPVRTFSI
jgi:hypothetical protein